VFLLLNIVAAKTLAELNKRIQHRTRPKLTEQQVFDEQLVYITKSMVGIYSAVFVKRKMSSKIKNTSF